MSKSSRNSRGHQQRLNTMTLDSPTVDRPSGLRAQLPFLFLAASVWHVIVTTGVFLLGRFELMRSQFDQNGLGRFADDGFMYQNEVVELCGVLKNQGLITWATWPTQLHVRLYSLPVATLGGSNFNILTIELLNLIYYLAILFLVFKLGELVFTFRTGLMAAAMVAVWPSFLLHTTQLLRDPLLITAVLILVLSLVVCLKRDYAWWRALLGGLGAAAAIVLIRIVRLPMWSMVWAIVVMGVLLLIVRLVSERRFPIGNVVFAMIVIAAVVITPRFQFAFHNQQVVRRPRMIVPEEIQKLPIEQQIAARRQAFGLRMDSSGETAPSEAGSDIDREVSFNNTHDIIRHIPRAIMVGFFAPFPNMWFAGGKQVGSGGRLLSGFETLLTYMIQCLALIGLWRQRKQVSVWLLFLITSAGALALGLVVANIGALYRLRYPFWVLLIILGAGGADQLLRRKLTRETSRETLQS